MFRIDFVVYFIQILYMANRHLSRSVVLQTLFEVDATGSDRALAHEALARNIGEYASRNNDDAFMTALFDGVLGKKHELDLIIEKAAPDWPLDRIAPLDRNVLRLGLYELLFADRTQVPAKVAINEAIELAKQYSGDSSGRFVNGVLGSIYKELGEPGKDEQGTRPRRREVRFEDMPIERLGGAVVYARDAHGTLHLAMVHDIFGHWTLSKGGIVGEETVEQGTVRGLKEEIGLDATLEEQIGFNEYVATHPEKGKVRKQVTYFLASAPYQELVLEQKGGLDDARWFKIADILALNFYEDILPVVTKAVTMLAAKRDM